MTGAACVASPYSIVKKGLIGVILPVRALHRCFPNSCQALPSFTQSRQGRGARKAQLANQALKCSIGE